MTTDIQRARDLLAHLVSRPDGTMQDYRDLYDEVLATFPLPAEASSEAVDAGGVPSYWVRDRAVESSTVAVLVHGGGWCMGTAAGYRELAHRISAAAHCRVLVVDYRLAPEHPYPEPLDDVLTAYRFARSQPGVTSVALVGDSSGGGLVTGAVVALRESGETPPDALVLMSPLVDLTGEAASLVERADRDPLPARALIEQMGGAFLAGRDPKATPLASPLWADLHDFPPTLALVGTDEGLYDDAVRLIDKIVTAGGDATLEVGENMVHIWPLFSFLPQARAATDLIGRFLAKHLA
ncbi:alpha/beta hydrolase [Frankia sp. AiPs1]|uniref:alpha/beta hydrolase n=1 Tax=Frankia sp. AiPs1 TaxID=573493 RepID=UPI0020446866|nr:alpha/beta hydrolase [Frankia sp. AiPs1]MCM3920519.1 alpha/beta hydrolase [Frankia sp. AiPs1]